MKSRRQALIIYSLPLSHHSAVINSLVHISFCYFFPDYLWRQVQKSGIVGSKDKFICNSITYYQIPSIWGVSLCSPMSSTWDCLFIHSIVHTVCYQTCTFANLVRIRMLCEVLMCISLIMNELSKIICRFFFFQFSICSYFSI